MKNLLIPAAALAASLLSLPAPVRAETRVCTAVTTLPATLSTPGVYCLTGDLATTMSSGTAVTLANHGVTLDCNGYKIGGLGAGPSSQAIGIGTGFGLEVAVVRNCNVRGFRTGISVAGEGLRIEDNRLDGNLSTGIQVSGSHNVVARNRVFDTGGNGLASGIHVIGGALVDDNTVSGVAAAADSLAVGIKIEGVEPARLRGNRVRGVSVAAGGAGPSPVGLYLSGPTRAALRDNHFAGNGGGGDVGMRCDDTAGLLEHRSRFSGYGAMRDGCDAK